MYSVCILEFGQCCIINPPSDVTVRYVCCASTSPRICPRSLCVFVIASYHYFYLLLDLRYVRLNFIQTLKSWPSNFPRLRPGPQTTPRRLITPVRSSAQSFQAVYLSQLLTYCGNNTVRKTRRSQGLSVLLVLLVLPCRISVNHLLSTSYAKTRRPLV